VAILVPRFKESATARNRVKRRLRELVRRELLATGRGEDIVLRATPAAYNASFDELREAVLRIARRDVTGR
jgi:ribonuclease P protein component